MKLISQQALVNDYRFRQNDDVAEAPEDELNTIAWGFLGSEFTELTYANWPIDRRVDAYLTHLGRAGLVNNGDAHQAIVQRVMANLGAAMRGVQHV